MKRNLMDFTGIAAIVVALGGLLAGSPSIIRALSDFRTKERESKLKEDKERAELAEKLGVPQQSTTKMLTMFVERLDKENAELKQNVEAHRQERNKEIADLKTQQDAQRAESDRQIKELKDKQEVMGNDMEKLSMESAKKDEVITQQGEQITQLQTDNERLTKRVRLLEEALIKAEVPIPNGDDKQ